LGTTPEASQSKTVGRVNRSTSALVIVGFGFGLLADLMVSGGQLMLPLTVVGNAHGIATLWSVELFLSLCVGLLLRRERGTCLVLTVLIYLLQPTLIIYLGPELWSVSGGLVWAVSAALARGLGLYLPRALLPLAPRA
jgi:hypothetical protein